MTRPSLWFDGEPNRFAQMRALFPQTQTAKVRYAEPAWQKLILRRDAQGRFLVGRTLCKLLRAA